MSLPFLLVLFLLLISFSVIAWILYGLWQDNYGFSSIRIRNRLNFFLTEGSKRAPESYKARVFSTNKSLNAFLSKSKLAIELDDQLVKGKLHIRIDLFLLLVIAAWLFAFIIFLSIHLSILFSLVSAGIVGALPFLTIRMLVARRQAELEEQLPNILDFISRAMQAGHTFVGSLQMASDESPEPIGSEFKEAFREINFGKSVQNAMSDLAERIDCPEMRYFAVAVFINHEIGGNLASLLSGVATLIRERLKLKMSVHAMTSEARVSAWILGLLPFAVALILFAVRPDFISVLWREPAGRTMLGYTLVLMGVGILWMQRLSKIRF